MNDNVKRESYARFYTQTTRWRDNDAYGHVNNVVYYSYFDSAANRFLIEECGLNIESSKVIGFVVASQCEYLSPVVYPEQLEVGLKVNKLGNKSVEYGLAIFKHDDDLASAYGRFTHVFVERQSGKSVPIPQSIRAGLQLIA